MMHAAWQRWHLSVATAALVLAGFSLLLLNGQLWTAWGVQHMRPYFLDLVAVLAAGEAHVRGIDVFAGNPLDPLGRPHVYGPAWLLTGRLGLTGRDAWWLGTVLAVVFVTAACALIAPRSRFAAGVTALALLSPGVMLGIERGNNDLVVFLLLALAAAWAGGPSRLRGFFAAAIVVVAAALKFYPLAGLAVLFGGGGSLKRAAGLALLGAGAFAVIWISQRAEIARVLALTPKPMTIFAYGVSVTHVTLSLLTAVRGWLALGAVPVLCVGAWWLWRNRRDLGLLLPREGVATAAFLAGAATWIACFLLASSFPYRGVLLLLLLPALLAPAGVRAGRLFASVLVFALWLGSPKFIFAAAAEANPANERALHVLAVITGAEQALMIGITITTAVIACGWVWRRWRAERQGVAPAATGPLSAN